MGTNTPAGRVSRRRCGVYNRAKHVVAAQRPKGIALDIVDLKCPNCGAQIRVDKGATAVTCEYCDSIFAVDSGSVAASAQYADQEEAGYQFEKGRQKAQAEAAEAAAEAARAQAQAQAAPKKRRTWLWVLGWIFVFPIPLSILMLNNERTKNIRPEIRVAITIIGWIVYLIWMFSGSVGSATNTNTHAANINTNNTAITQTANANNATNANQQAA